ncbi:heavy metal translocating P-type ATPase [Apiospora kogelbergensis]|uniref:heavy metal translocating P-type ATPase n=1 Tax=Apiospora kogelbergensis TaxID=1337665 RepID=UPI003131D44C
MATDPAREPLLQPLLQPRDQNNNNSNNNNYQSISTTTNMEAPVFQATLAIGGMSCTSCSNTIAKELEKQDWISSVSVNFATAIANVGIRNRDAADRVVKAIANMGFEAQVQEVRAPVQERARFVQVRLDGFHCVHCPSRAVASLSKMEGIVNIDHEPTMATPVIKITYIPSAPTLTIRKILSTLESVDPAFKASIHHPPTAEEVSRKMQSHHRKQLLYRICLTLVMAIPTFIVGIVYMSLVPAENPTRMYLMMPWTSGISRAQIALFVLSTPIFFFGADVFHRKALKEVYSLWRPGSKTPILQRFYNFGSMNMLMSLGTTIAYVSSCCQLIAAGVTKPTHINDANFYFDSVVFLTLFLLVGRIIEAYSKAKTGDAVEALGKLRPTEAVLVKPDGSGSADKVVAVDLLDFGDLVRIPHGASPPCDGKVMEGKTKFDESSLTGESRLVNKNTGDEVFSGTVNKDAPIVIQITGVAGRSMLDKIVNIVRDGQTKKAPIEDIANALTSYFVPIITLIAILTWLTWLSLGISGAIPESWMSVSSGGWVAFSLQFAISVFVVACPCGLGLAAPTALFVGGGLAAKHGILANGGGEAFEKASKIDCVVFDKTGTLTEGGEPKVVDTLLYPEKDDASEEMRSKLLASLRAIEENSSHPIAKAIVSYCTRETERRTEVTHVEEIPGRGLKAKYSAISTMAVGNEALMRELKASISPTPPTIFMTGKTKPTLSIEDRIRDEAVNVVRDLQARGTKVWMLSGDNAKTARAVALRIGIPETNVISEVLPADKAAKVKYLQSTLKAGINEDSNDRATVAMIGDGINDAPALTTADIGIAIGSGSDIAISSADFVLIQSDLRSVVTLLSLSNKVFQRIKINFAWALVYNLVAIPFAAGCFYAVRTPSGGHLTLDPVWASLAMALSSISVVLSSLALRSRIPGLGFRG